MIIHVLLIDDDKDEITILREAFDSAGIAHKCTWVQSVDHALKVLEYLKPHIIFIDLNMPAVDGIAGIRLIRQRFLSLKDVPLLLYTNYVGDKEREAIAAGANYCIQKPSLLKDLSTRIKEIFKLLTFSTDVH
jgi:two-component system response regulator YesN